MSEGIYLAYMFERPGPLELLDVFEVVEHLEHLELSQGLGAPGALSSGTPPVLGGCVPGPSLVLGVVSLGPLSQDAQSWEGAVPVVAFKIVSQTVSLFIEPSDQPLYGVQDPPRRLQLYSLGAIRQTSLLCKNLIGHVLLFLVRGSQKGTSAMAGHQRRL